MEHLYQYKAAVMKVVDGDTFVAMIYLGFGIFIEKQVRLYGIDTPELTGRAKKRGHESKKRLEELIKEQEVILIAMEQEDKYGRFLARCLLQDAIGSDVTNILLEEGLGKEYYGGSKT